MAPSVRVQMSDDLVNYEKRPTALPKNKAWDLTTQYSEPSTFTGAGSNSEGKKASSYMFHMNDQGIGPGIDENLNCRSMTSLNIAQDRRDFITNSAKYMYNFNMVGKNNCSYLSNLKYIIAYFLGST